MINRRLFTEYGIDTEKNLRIAPRCARPFDTLLIDKWGSCFVCECQAWLPQSVGNIHKNTIPEILHSALAREMRASVSDGTYRYCNNQLCTYIQKNDIHEAQGHGLRHIRLALDDSCNLSCPSCRVSSIFTHKGRMFDMRLRAIRHVIAYIRTHQGPLEVHIGSDGDPFASVIYRRFMREMPALDNVRYTFQTNGLLFQQMFPRVRHVIERTRRIAVSIDGATQETYERLRRGGSWSKIVRNLEFMGQHKNLGYGFEMHMVVQRDNWREMPAMLELAKEVGADKVNFTQIADWHTYKDFESVRCPDTTEFRRTVENCELDPWGNTWLDRHDIIGI